MRYIFIMLLALLGVLAQSQVVNQSLGAPNTIVTTKGNHYVDSVFRMPKRLISDARLRDTGSVYWGISDSTINAWTGFQWLKFRAGGSFANNGLFKNGDTIKLGGDIFQNVTLNTTNASAITFSTLGVTNHQFPANGNAYFALANADAKMGIGTNDPTTKLDVRGVGLIAAPLTGYEFTGWPTSYESSFNHNVLGAFGREPSLDILVDSNSSFGIGGITFRILESGSPFMSVSRFGANAFAKIEANTFADGLGRKISTLEFYLGDTLPNRLHRFALAGPGNHFFGFRKLFTVDVNEALFVGTAPNGTSDFAFNALDTTYFAVNADNRSLYVLNMPFIPADTTNYKPMVINNSNGKWYKSSWPETGGGGGGTDTNYAIAPIGIKYGTKDSFYLKRGLDLSVDADTNLYVSSVPYHSTINAYSSNNKRSDAASTIQLANGRLLCAYTAYGSATGDNDSAVIATKYSDDNGLTWQGLDTAVQNTSNGSYIPSLYFNPARDTLRMLYFRQNASNTGQIYMTYSVDFTADNPTWSTPTLAFGSGSQYYSPAADRVFVNKAGTYFYPLPIHISGLLQSSSGRYDGYMMRSTNGGATWDTIPGVRLISPDTLCVEGGLFQTDDPNSLMTYYFRTRSGQVYFAQSSTAAGSVYGSVFPTGLFASNSTTTIKYLEKYKALIAIGNRYMGAGNLNGNVGRIIMDMYVKHMSTVTVNTLLPTDGVNGGWQFLYRIDSANGFQFIEPSVTFLNSHILVAYSKGDYAIGDTFSLESKIIPYYFIHGTDSRYTSNLVLNKTFNSSDPNFIEFYINGISTTNDYLKVQNQSSGSQFGLKPWFRNKTTSTQNPQFRFDVDMPTSSNGAPAFYWNVNTNDGQYNLNSAAFQFVNDETVVTNVRANGMLEIRKISDGSTSELMKMYLPVIGEANGYTYFKNVTGGTGAYATWIDVKAFNSQYGIYMTPRSPAGNGSVWIDPDNGSGADVSASNPLFRVTNFGTASTDERYRLLGNGTNIWNDGTGEVMRLDMTSRTLKLNTVGTTSDITQRGIYFNRSIGANKDSVTTIASASTHFLLVIDTAAAPEQGKFKKILASNLGFVSNNIYTADGTATNRTVTISGFLNFLSGEVKVGSATDQGAFTLQNTGGLYQNGAVKMDLGSDATGDIYYRDGSGNFVRLPISTNGKVLTITGGLPAWEDPTGGGGDTTEVVPPLYVVSGTKDTLKIRYDTTTITIRTTGFNDSALTVNTSNISTVQRLIDTAAAIRADFPAGGVTSVAGANGLTATGSASVTVSLGGTLNATTDILGAGNTLRLGTSGSKIGTLAAAASTQISLVSDARINLLGNIAYQAQSVNSDANATVSANIGIVEVNTSNLTADRTLTLPAASTHGQVLTIVVRFASSGFHFDLTSGIENNASGSNITQLQWGTTYTLMVNASLAWMIVQID